MPNLDYSYDHVVRKTRPVTSILYHASTLATTFFLVMIMRRWSKEASDSLWSMHVATIIQHHVRVPPICCIHYHRRRMMIIWISKCVGNHHHRWMIICSITCRNSTTQVMKPSDFNPISCSKTVNICNHAINSISCCQHLFIPFQR